MNNTKIYCSGKRPIVCPYCKATEYFEINQAQYKSYRVQCNRCKGHYILWVEAVCSIRQSYIELPNMGQES